MRLVLSGFLMVVLFDICRATYHHDYYWRDYKGTIPQDAIPGGKSLEGKITYIGQALHQLPNGKLIPGAIDEDNGTLAYYWNNNAYFVDSYFKILCFKCPDNYEWVPTDNVAIKTMDADKFVLGGYDGGPLYVGRVYVNGELVVGKVTVEKPYDRMCYVLNGKSECLKTEYQVLALT